MYFRKRLKDGEYMEAAVILQTEQNPICAEPQVSGSKFYLFCKRLADIVISLVCLLVLWLPMLVIGLIVRLDSPGPAIFAQERLGKGGKPFVMYKFRSMYTDAEKDGPQWASKDDMRCTKFGKFMRQSRVDEFPQLFNILKGDMSIVGPRPERAVFYDEFEKYIPHFRQRLLVKPDLTGWAQVNGGYELRPEEKIVYDLEYISKRNLHMDIKCIWKTFRVVFHHDGAR